jgi:menaquinone-dependent protoporphyrinogen oxidase
MKPSVLVTFATRYGSTREVAQSIADTLKESGIEVDFQLIREVRSVEKYQAVVLGAPLYMFRWHKDARRFLSKHRKEIVQRPIAIFALGPIHDEEKEWQDVQKQLDKALAKYPWLNPAAVEIFGGRFDPARLRFPYSFLPAMRKIPASDIRDWAKIKSWAENLRDLLKLNQVKTDK